MIFFKRCRVATGSGILLENLRVTLLTCSSSFLALSVQFRTTPMDSTGVPHVLEHTVLCGSQKYPCRDPFFKMLNRSLSTFMNAFTGKTDVLNQIMFALSDFSRRIKLFSKRKRGLNVVE